MKNIDECTQLYIEVFNDEPWDDGWQEANAKKRLMDIFSNQKFLGIGVNDKTQNIIGFLAGYTERWLDSNHFNLNEICIKTDLQNQSIGSQLMAELEKACKEKISVVFIC